MRLDRYDAGLLGGDKTWTTEMWWNYMRVELERAYEFYQDQLDNGQSDVDLADKAGLFKERSIMNHGDLPAYPQALTCNPMGDVLSSDEPGYGRMGLTIRQRYAMAAMQGMLSYGRSDYNSDDNTAKLTAEAAFRFADGMIAFETQDLKEKNNA